MVPACLWITLVKGGILIKKGRCESRDRQISSGLTRMGGQESAHYAIGQFFLPMEGMYYVRRHGTIRCSQQTPVNTPNHYSTECQAHQRELILGIPIWLKGLVTISSHLC